MSIFMISLDRFDPMIGMIFHQGFKFLEFLKGIIFGSNGIYPKKVGEIINEGEEIFNPTK
jgi:hypothetical protein